MRKIGHIQNNTFVFIESKAIEKLYDDQGKIYLIV
jgi:hypothetical protein